MAQTPQITSLETAIKTYYENIELTSQNIRTLFKSKKGDLSSKTITQLKNRASEQMAADNIPSLNSANVNTRAAYKSWGLDITDLENRLCKLKQFQLAS